MLLVTNVTGGRNHLHLLRELIGRSSKAEFAVAFITEHGALELLKLIDRSKIKPTAFTIMTSTDLKITDPKALKHLLGAGVHIRRYAGGQTFHLKMYCFTSRRGREFVLGSSNMTWGGLISNMEVSIHFRDVEDSKLAASAVRLLGQIEKNSVPWTKRAIAEYEKVWCPPENDSTRIQTVSQYLTRRQIYKPIPPDFSLRGKVCAFTGKFRKATHAECERLTKRAGGRVTSENVTHETDVLVVGANGSPTYLMKTYGLKIRTARDYRKETGKPVIMLESDWVLMLR